MKAAALSLCKPIAIFNYVKGRDGSSEEVNRGEHTGDGDTERGTKRQTHRRQQERGRERQTE